MSRRPWVREPEASRIVAAYEVGRGLMVVPKDPADAMVLAGARSIRLSAEIRKCDASEVRQSYRAMLAAAKETGR